MKVAIIDTGCDSNNYQIDYGRVENIIIRDELSGSDEVGHGTALISSYQRLIKDIHIYSIKIFTNFRTDVSLIIEALEYIYNNLEVDVINLSIGVHTYSKELEEICIKLFKKNTILIAAFDSNNYLSYPAAFDVVMGVSSSPDIANINQFYYIENSPINVLGYGGCQVVNWLNNTKKVVKGNSFLLPYLVSNFKNFKKNEASCDSILKESVNKIITQNMNFHNLVIKRKENIDSIKNAVVFPINKEIINMINNENVLKFNIDKMFDYNHSYKIGKPINKFAFKTKNDGNILKIKEIDWMANFDTFIFGHVDDRAKMLYPKLTLKIIEKCICFKKNLVVFDEVEVDKYIEKFESVGCFIYSPNLPKYIYPQTRSELWYNSVPTLCVSGTSSSQGKFNLQLDLKNEIEKFGYNIGQLGTEPNSELLGFDFAYPNGFGTSKMFSDNYDILFVNQMIHELIDRDLIIIGTQSNLVPYTYGNTSMFPLLQRNILLGAQPDGVILCVNAFDNIKYIERTIQYVESFHDCKVISIVIYPLWKKIDEISGEYTERDLSKEELSKVKNKIKKIFKLPVFINGRNIKELAEVCINFFQECES